MGGTRAQCIVDQVRERLSRLYPICLSATTIVLEDSTGSSLYPSQMTDAVSTHSAFDSRRTYVLSHAKVRPRISGVTAQPAFSY